MALLRNHMLSSCAENQTHAHSVSLYVALTDWTIKAPLESKPNKNALQLEANLAVTVTVFVSDTFDLFNITCKQHNSRLHWTHFYRPQTKFGAR